MIATRLFIAAVGIGGYCFYLRWVFQAHGVMKDIERLLGGK